MVRGNDLDRRSKAQVDLITKRRLSGDVGGNIYVCIYNVEIDFILFSGEILKEEGVREKLWKLCSCKIGYGDERRLRIGKLKNFLE